MSSLQAREAAKSKKSYLLLRIFLRMENNNCTNKFFELKAEILKIFKNIQPQLKN